MIAYLHGTIVHKTERSFIMDVHGVGYEIYAAQPFLSSIRIHEEGEAYTFLHVKENILDLYGFPTVEDKKIFVLLLGVSGIGPKSALHLFDVVSPQNIIQAIFSQQPEALVAKGIGRKTAEKITREIASKLDKEAIGAISDVSLEQQDLIEALKVLGYQGTAIQQILPTLSKDGSLEDKVKQALRLLQTVHLRSI